MRTTNVMETLTKLDVLACLTGAIGHDVDHPGVNQAFEKAIKSDIALMHNFRSVLENHHLNVHQKRFQFLDIRRRPHVMNI